MPRLLLTRPGPQGSARRSGREGEGGTMSESTALFAADNFEKVRLPPQEAEPLPHWAYTSAVWYERELERIFRKSWNYVGHVSQVLKPGDFFTLDVAGV